MIKSIFLYLLFLLNGIQVSSQIFDVSPIKISGDDTKRINLVILSEGYQSTEFGKFENDATNFTNNMFSQSPFAEYANYFNFYIIKVPSNESGADHPGTATNVSEPVSPIIDIDTYFNTGYDGFNIHRLLYSSDYATINTVLANNFPQFDQTIILVNSSVYGGSGGVFPFASTGRNSSEIVIHELGHSMFDLKDEYYPGDNFAAEAINMTQVTNTNLVRWKNWIGINGVGIYPYGTSGTDATWNRPHQNCKMRYLGYLFCSVCKEGIIEKIHDLLSPIDSFTPVSNILNDPSFPVNFNLTLIKPNPNTLVLNWTLNAANLATNVDYVSLMGSDLILGDNVLTAIVTDNTPSLIVNNHEITHAYMVTWTINKSSHGIEDITSSKNNLSISMYPNPTNNIIHFKFENGQDLNLKVDIVSMDGKKIKSLIVLNHKTQEMDLSNLPNGIYISNFYANNVLVTSKKIVKN